MEIYWNSRKKLFSIRDRGKVIGHSDNIVINNPLFVVNESGRQRVLRTKQKNVHAFIRGELVLPDDDNWKDERRRFYVENAGLSDYSYAVYNPYDNCDHYNKGLFRVKCVLGEIFITEEFNSYIKMVHAYVADDKPQIKVKMTD